MTKKHALTLIHLYPREMNIYGDIGNIITLKKRCEWRGINLNVESISLSQSSEIRNGDIYFMGGGQDDDMFKVYKDILKYRKEFLLNEVKKKKVFLLICGGLQLFGNYFLDSKGRTIEGLGVLPIKTMSIGDNLKNRSLGTIITELSPELQLKINSLYKGNPSKYLVGFENHSGQTYIDLKNTDIETIGKVLYGVGNNINDKKEGFWYKNVFASYMHGSFLPKNPHFADLLIGLALKNKYGNSIELSSLNDDIEWQAHDSIIRKYIN